MWEEIRASNAMDEGGGLTPSQVSSRNRKTFFKLFALYVLRLLDLICVRFSMLLDCQHHVQQGQLSNRATSMKVHTFSLFTSPVR